MPSVSIVIPTYNSERTLAQCLESIARQDYPREKIEIIIADGGSKDKTLEIAKNFGVNKILHNPLRTGEAGKAVGVEVAKNEIILFQDSDNVLDGQDWLRRMVEPFEDTSIVGAEPLYYTYRKEDSLITRYCALLGMNDPLCLYLGNYDRYSYVTGKWTELLVKITDYGSYLLLELNEKNIPTIGANGFLVRREALRRVDYKPYLFDVDVVYQLIRIGQNRFAKVKIGIVHMFASNARTFMRKTYRRIRDYLFYEKRGMRNYPWRHLSRLRILKFTLYTLLLVPIVRDSIKGYKKVPDKAWLFHPLACWLTLFTYSIKFIIVLVLR
ncbi:glycosyltransferase family 2 protein [Thermofilum sp.]|uniref:glycosyltransferase family 2 protein n=1 Tax=Thermofilum sp. TaxID=1961369 RepID=UPI003163E111